MRRTVGILLVLAGLAACRPLPPEIPLPEVPAGRFLEAIEQRRAAFPGLRALGGATAVRNEKRRVFESVGVLVDRQQRFRIEVYDPLGAPFLTLLWDGADLLVRTADGRVTRPGAAVLEKFAGPGIGPAEFAAALTGNVPADTAVAVRSFCGEGGRCVTEFRSGDRSRRVRTVASPFGILIAGYDVYRRGELLYRVEFGDERRTDGYGIPATVRIEQPRAGVMLIVEYADVDAEVPPEGEWLVLSSAEGPGS